jgi:transposase InsO family protein
VSHRNAPLTPAGRLRLVQRCEHRPIAHVAAEAAISRQCLSKWVNRYRTSGEAGLLDRASVPHHQPATLDPALVDRIEKLRRDKKWSARQIADQLTAEGHQLSVSTVGRWLKRLGINRRRFLDPNGAENRKPPNTIVARYPGHMVHVDIKKVGRIPDGGGWRIHGKNSDHARTVERRKAKGVRAGYIYLHSIVDGFSRLAYTEALPDEKGVTAVGFINRARVFFAAHGIARFTRVVTDNGSCYRSAVFARTLAGMRHQFIRPYTPRHNGKVERYNRILAEEFLYAREWTSETQRAAALEVWNVHYNYHRPHTAAGNRPPATRLHTGVTNVMASYI